jgi:peptidoglycan/LPS O-acetylase OafA/YrhL
MDGKKLKYIPTLDGWRAIAVILVLLAHTVESITELYGLPRQISFLAGIGGQGVNIFFGLSGFLITTHLIKEMESTGINLKIFYLKRFFRLMPALWVYLLSIFILGNIGYVPDDSKGIFSSLLFFRNYTEGLNTTNQIWSLSIEEHFYLLLPSFLILLKKPKRIVFGLLISCFAITVWRKLGTVSAFTELVPFSAYHDKHTFQRMDFMLFGVLVAYLQAYFPNVFKKLSWHPLIPIILTIVVIYGPIPLRPTARAVVMPLLFVSTLMRANNLFSKVLEIKAIRYVGKISYSVYLWQQLVTFKLHNAPKFIQVLTGEWWSIPIAIGIGAISYHLIENPVRKWGYRKVLKLH